MPLLDSQFWRAVAALMINNAVEYDEMFFMDIMFRLVLWNACNKQLIEVILDKQLVK